MRKWVYLSSAVGGAVIALFIVSGFHFPPTGMSFSAVVGAMVAGAIGGLVLWPIVAVIGVAIWYLRYALLGIISFVIIIWLYFSHQPLWEDVVLGIA
ncbi:MAG: hypothetical protein KGI28_10125, partial [Thaumarchaeota archaeon]|nr:hypothetical protein [Nitrososphaerota archaeon]